MRSVDLLEIVSRHLAAPAIGNEIELDLLAFAQHAETGALDRANVHESIAAAIIGLDETKTLLAVEPFHGSRRHGRPFLKHRDAGPRANTRVGGRAVEFALVFGIKVRWRGAVSTGAGQIIRPSIDSAHMGSDARLGKPIAPGGPNAHVAGAGCNPGISMTIDHGGSSPDAE